LSQSYDAKEWGTSYIAVAKAMKVNYWGMKHYKDGMNSLINGGIAARSMGGLRQPGYSKRGFNHRGGKVSMKYPLS